jgi:hypothetical protein
MAQQDQNDTPSNLSRISQEFRDREIARNAYTRNDEYVSTHPNAISDGDERGKGEGDRGSIGGRTDIQKRQQSIAKNKYSLNNPYNIDNA